MPSTNLLDSTYSNDEQIQENKEIETIVSTDCYYCVEFIPTTNKKEYEKHVVLNQPQ